MYCVHKDASLANHSLSNEGEDPFDATVAELDDVACQASRGIQDTFTML